MRVRVKVRAKVKGKVKVRAKVKGKVKTTSREQGAGRAIDGASQRWYVATGSRTPDLSPRLVSGSHVLNEGLTSIASPGKVKLFVTVEDSTAPSEVVAFLDGARLPLTLELGTGARGTYSVEVDEAAGCRSYRFELTAANNAVERYPAAGVFRTYGDGGCTESWQP